MEKYETILAICTVIFLFFVCAVAFDIAKSLWYKIKNREYSWESLKNLEKIDSLWTMLLVVAILVLGAYGSFYFYGQGIASEIKAHYSAIEEELQANLDYCHHCGEKFPEEYMYTSPSDDLFCPNCIYSDYEALLTGEVRICTSCEDFYYLSDTNGLGLCCDCEDHIIVECSMCTNYTYEWRNSGFSVCPDCMREVLDATDVEEIIRSLYE